ncbi:Nitrogen permease regulator 3, partial [Quaeritorhiza haematococci]
VNPQDGCGDSWLEDEFLGFDPQFISDILSPKVALCDRKFELTVDDVTFVGHPTLLNADRPGTGHQFARAIQKARLARRAAQQQRGSTSASTGGGGGAGGPGGSGGGLGRDRDSSDDMLASSSTFLGGFGTTGSVAASQVAGGAGQGGGVGVGGGSGTGGGGSNTAHQLTMFNLVFAMQPKNRKTFSHEVQMMHQHVISKLTAGLKYEQLKRGYIRKEAEVILSIREEAQSNTPGGRGKLVDVIDRVLAASSLARLLVHVYNAINEIGMAHVVINSSLDLWLQIPLRSYISGHFSSPSSPSDSAALTAPYNSYPDVNDLTNVNPDEPEYPMLRPYHALLLLRDPEEILKCLPMDSSPLLIELVQIVTPMQCFEDLQTTLDCSLSHLYRLAAHLVHWRQARIIDVISLRNVYVISPHADLSTLLTPTIHSEFSSQFPTLDLARILSALSANPRPVLGIVPGKEMRTLYLEAVTFLLRKGVVGQVHMYIYLMVPEHIRRRVHALLEGEPPDSSSTQPHPENPQHPNTHPQHSQPPGTHSTHNSQHPHQQHGGQQHQKSFDSIMIPDPANPTPIEREYIRYMAASQPVAVGTLFLRLVPYFSGKYHVHEIMFRENVARRDLKTVLK